MRRLQISRLRQRGRLLREKTAQALKKERLMAKLDECLDGLREVHRKLGGDPTAGLRPLGVIHGPDGH